MDWMISWLIDLHLKQSGAFFSSLPIEDQCSIAHALGNIKAGNAMIHSLSNGNRVIIGKDRCCRPQVVPAEQIMTLLALKQKRQEDAVSEK
ncbi:hypothetical protein B4O97_04020 [Marispirochaeta aestuarii]|uniref:Uncharacterized protein n=1 Tax=Marispirochaeta aestuarii TaxID=1963862 RepID=A0A1Y1S1Q0_9SPIO|nr:hypothetical protein [Marispirochaeta aestuarii]ORC37367.1 hypothetical protein B4O97_04020 [Marispirochaeta aestuarii]